MLKKKYRKIYLLEIDCSFPILFNEERNKLSTVLKASTHSSGYYPDSIELPRLFQHVAAPPPGLWALALSSDLGKKGFEVEYLRINTKSNPEELRRLFINFPKGSIFLISVTSVNYMVALDLVDLIHLTVPDSYFILGGPHISYAPSLTRIPKYAHYWRGEAYGKLHHFIQSVTDGDTKKFDPQHIKVERELAFKFDWRLYLKHSSSLDSLMPRMMITSYCPHRCAFCVPRKGSRPTEKSVVALRENVESFWQAFGNRPFHIRFVDPDFLVSTKYSSHPLAFLREYNCTWDFQTRVPEDINAYKIFLKEAKESGCRSVFFGIESSDPAISSRIRKKIPMQNIEPVCNLSTEHGLSTLVQFIVGLPGQTWKNVEDDIALAQRLVKNKTVGSANFEYLKLYPGTDIANNPERYGVKIAPTFSYTRIESEIMHSTDTLSRKDIEKLYGITISEMTSCHYNHLAEDVRNMVDMSLKTKKLKRV